MNERNSLKEVSLCFGMVLFVLGILFVVPEWEIGGIKIKQVNIFSDILKDEIDSLPVVEERDTPLIDTLVKKNVTTDSINAFQIEDFTENGNGLARFRELLDKKEWAKRPVRIAFLGDSYIEADIITEDVRAVLQGKYGGRGVGFVPVNSLAADYRQTVKHSADKWTTYSMIYHDKVDWQKMLMSGEYFIPSEGAHMKVKGENVKGSARFGEAHFFFQNAKKTKIQVNIDGRDTVFMPPAKDSVLQHISLHGDLRELQFIFTNVEGFVGYGVFLNDPTGVYVDNFAVRGSSGLVLSIVNQELMKQLSEWVKYDLVVMEFGLNVVTPDAKAYSSYRKQMVRVVNHIKRCFPGADLLLLGVSDRGYRNSDGTFGTKPGVIRLMEEQREIARETGITFWNMYDAMGGKNAMVKYVKQEPPLANKDYTHINHLGGKKIAEELVKALQVETKVSTGK